MTTHQPAKPMDTTPRDPYLPPPAVVDWLLEQDWSEMIPVTCIQYQGSSPHGITKSKLYEYQQAHTGMGADEGGRILLPVEVLDVLRKDHAIRQAALEEKRQALGSLLRNAVQNGGRILLQERACEAES